MDEQEFRVGLKVASNQALGYWGADWARFKATVSNITTASGTVMVQVKDLENGNGPDRIDPQESYYGKFGGHPSFLFWCKSVSRRFCTRRGSLGPEAGSVRKFK